MVSHSWYPIEALNRREYLPRFNKNAATFRQSSKPPSPDTAPPNSHAMRPQAKPMLDPSPREQTHLISPPPPPPPFSQRFQNLPSKKLREPPTNLDLNSTDHGPLTCLATTVTASCLRTRSLRRKGYTGNGPKGEGLVLDQGNRHEERWLWGGG